MAAPAATPLTVIVCAVFQSVLLNVTAPDTVALVSSLLAGVTVTSAEGCAANTTVWRATPPTTTAASVLSTLTGSTITVSGSIDSAR